MSSLLLPYDTIIKAHEGDPIAIQAVLDRYAGYIRYFSILGWANLFGDVVHQTIIGKPEQNPLSTNSTIEQVQGVSEIGRAHV